MLFFVVAPVTLLKIYPRCLRNLFWNPKLRRNASDQRSKLLKPRIKLSEIGLQFLDLVSLFLVPAIVRHFPIRVATSPACFQAKKFCQGGGSNYPRLRMGMTEKL